MAVSAAQFLQMTRNFFVKFSWSFNENFCLSTEIFFGIDSQILRHKLESVHRERDHYSKPERVSELWALVGIQIVRQTLQRQIQC